MSEHEPESAIQLVLLDAHALFRVSLRRFLASEPGFEVVHDCAEPDEALKVLRESSVEVVLLDFNIGIQQMADFIHAARRSGYSGKFLIVTTDANPRSAACALRLGTSGIFLKSDEPDLLEGAIRLVVKGGVWLDQTIARLLTKDLLEWPSEPVAPNTEVELTERQSKVLTGISRGLTNRDIAESLGLSEGSIKSVVQQLFYKCGVRSRSQLVRIALDRGPTSHLMVNKHA